MLLRKVFRSAGFVSLFFLVANCDTNQQINRADSVPSNPTAAVRNFRQLEETLVKITGIDSIPPLMKVNLLGLRPRLSPDGTAGKVSSASLLSATVMVSTYCERLAFHELAMAPKKRKFYGDLNLFGTVEQLSEKLRGEIIGKFVREFWRRPPTEEEMRTLVDLMDTIEKESIDKARTLSDVLTGVCTVVGSSLDALSV